MLDLILTARAEANFISSQSVCSICFSDHHLLRCEIGIRRPPPIINKYSFRRINSMNIDASRSFMLRSKLFDEDLCVNVDEFADLIDSEVTRQLVVYAPLQTRSRRCGQNDSRWLSTKAREAKRLHRRLERRYHCTRLDVDKKAFSDARCAARDSIMKSRADDIRGKLAKVEGDARATWRTAQKLLHSKPPVYQNDA